MFIDSCASINKISRASIKKEIDYIINTESNPSDWNKILSIKDKNIFTAIAVSPEQAIIYNNEIENKLLKLIKKNKIIAIGVIGLDYHNKKASKNIQKKVFQRQLVLAKENNLPVIISCPKSYQDCYEILKKIYKDKVKGVINFNSENKKQIKAFIDLGMFVSFSGDIISRRNKKAAKIIPLVPQNKFLIRSLNLKNKNKDYSKLISDIKKTVEKIVLTRKRVSIEDIARITSYNAVSLFQLPVKLKDKYTYKIRNSLYINLTNRCTNKCDFCPRLKEPVVKGYYLKLKKEPTAKEVIKEIDNPKKFDEIVFCGYGEPTIRLKTMKKIAKWIKENGGKTRLDTNGLGSLIAGYNIAPQLKGLFDTISISLNFHNKNLYLKHCHPIFGEKTWKELLRFIEEAKEITPKVILTVIEKYKDVDINKCQKIADKLKVNFRRRTYYEQAK